MILSRCETKVNINVFEKKTAKGIEICLSEKYGLNQKLNM